MSARAASSRSRPEPVRGARPGLCADRVVEQLASKGRELGVELAATELERVDAIAARSFEGQRFSFSEELQRPWTRAWVAQTGGERREIVAFLVAWHVADELHVLHVATEASARRVGHGEALMRVALDYAGGSGVRMVLLEVRRSNRPAIKLYRKLGFTALGLRPRYYSDGEDAVEMVLHLDPATGAALASKDEVRLEL